MQSSSQKRYLLVACVGTSSCRQLRVVPAVILIHFGVPIRIPGNLESEQVRETKEKIVLAWCFGKTFRGRCAPVA